MKELDLSTLGALDVSTYRFERSVVVDVRWPVGRETFFLVEGERSLGLMASDAGDPTYGEPRIFLVPKPMALDLDASEEELMLLIWQVLGGER
jgi:hypothetical protein